MEDYGRKMADMLMAGNVETQRAAVSIAIRADHPKIDTLRRLLKELACETLVESVDGATEVTSGLYKPGAEDRLKQLVREMIGAEAFDALLIQLEEAAAHLDLVDGGRAVLKGLQDPKRIGGMVRLAAETGLFRELPNHDMTRLANKAVEQERTGKPILDHVTTEGTA